MGPQNTGQLHSRGRREGRQGLCAIPGASQAEDEGRWSTLEVQTGQQPSEDSSQGSSIQVSTGLVNCRYLVLARDGSR